MASRRSLTLLIVVALTAVLAGCGGTGTLPGHSTTATSAAQTPSTQLGVVRAWAAALQKGDMTAAASYFALPSVFANGDGSGGLGAVEIHTRHEAVEVNETLTCGAKIISGKRQGKYLAVLFRLTNRAGAGADCGSGAGEEASTDFVIRNGKIVEWVRAITGAGGASPAQDPTAPGSTI